VLRRFRTAALHTLARQVVHALHLKRGFSIVSIALAACTGRVEKSPAPPTQASMQPSPAQPAPAAPELRQEAPAYSLDHPTSGLPEARARDGEFMRGVLLGPLVNEGTDTAQRAALAKSLDAAIAAGATDLELLVQWSQTTPASLELAPQDQTIADERLEWLMDQAHARKLRVLVTPTLVVDGEGQAGRPDVSPKEAERWWWSYRRVVIAYGRIAGKHHAWGLTLGTDLPAMARDQASLDALIRDVRKVFKGKLGYSAAAADVPSIKIWPSIDFVAVTPSRPATGDDASTAQALAAEAAGVEQLVTAQQKELFLSDATRSVRPAASEEGPELALRLARAQFAAWQASDNLRGGFMGLTEPARSVLSHWWGRSPH
jgi:hypothetical protein